ncbi:MAG: tetratricopeptide repeat protein [Bacteroidota bacterium]
MDTNLPLTELQAASLQSLDTDLRQQRDDPFFALMMVDNPTATASLMEQFAADNPQYQQVVFDLSQRQVTSLSALLQDQLADILKAENANQYLVHIAMAEGSFVEEFLEGVSTWIPQLNDDRDALFRGFPMRILMWTLPYTIGRMQKEAEAFWEAIPFSYDFRTESASGELFEKIAQLAQSISESSSASAYYQMGHAVAEIGLINNAVGCMQQVLEMEDAGEWEGKAHYQLGQLLEGDQQAALALKHYQKALELLSTTEADLRAEAYAQMAGLYRRGGDIGTGIKLLKQGLAEQATPVAIAGFQRRLAALYRRKGDLGQAISLYEEAAATFETENEPGRAAEAWQQLAGLKQDQQKPSEALAAYQKALPLAQAAENEFLILALEDSIEDLSEEVVEQQAPKKKGKGLFGKLFGGNAKK